MGLEKLNLLGGEIAGKLNKVASVAALNFLGLPHRAVNDMKKWHAKTVAF